MGALKEHAHGRVGFVASLWQAMKNRESSRPRASDARLPDTMPGDFRARLFLRSLSIAAGAARPARRCRTDQARRACFRPARHAGSIARKNVDQERAARRGLAAPRRRGEQPQCRRSSPCARCSAMRRSRRFPAAATVSSCRSRSTAAQPQAASPPAAAESTGRRRADPPHARAISSARRRPVRPRRRRRRRPRTARRARVVTIAGAGGIGKTRLAQAVAHRLLRSHAGGVWWVELAALSDAGARRRDRGARPRARAATAGAATHLVASTLRAKGAAARARQLRAPARRGRGVRRRA